MPPRARPAARRAQLWLGTHPSAPSQVLSTDGAPLGPLRAALGPALLGNAVYHKFGGDLPFLFKVLAIDTALSIQAHPNKADAQRLHAKNSQLYPDPNHKPELAIALTPFEGRPPRPGRPPPCNGAACSRAEAARAAPASLGSPCPPPPPAAPQPWSASGR